MVKLDARKLLHCLRNMMKKLHKNCYELYFQGWKFLYEIRYQFNCVSRQKIVQTG